MKTPNIIYLFPLNILVLYYSLYKGWKKISAISYLTIWFIFFSRFAFFFFIFCNYFLFASNPFHFGIASYFLEEVILCSFLILFIFHFFRNILTSLLMFHSAFYGIVKRASRSRTKYRLSCQLVGYQT
jgi:hypothetical protein